MKKIPTAKEFVDNSLGDLMFVNKMDSAEQEEVIESHIAFAKIYVEVALNAAADKAISMNDWEIERVSRRAIRDAYPLTNIK